MKTTSIISGTAKGRQLSVAAGIRPTQEMVRKAFVDIMHGAFQDSVVLELFAGSGAIGIEALSNGAREVIFVENNIQCCNAIKKNLSALGFDKDKGADSVLFMDAERAIAQLEQHNKRFDIIFLDPPYYKDLAKNTLQRLSACDIVTPHCVIVAEHNRKDFLESSINNITCFKQKRYGDTFLSFYKKVESSK